METRLKQHSVAIQCQWLSRRGGGLPAAILPVADRLKDVAVVVTADPPETSHPVALVTVKRRASVGASVGVLRDTAVRLVHTHGLWSPLSLSAVIWRRLSGGSTIVSPHGMLDPWALSKSRLKKAFALRLVERAHMNNSVIVHALNTAEADTIRAAGITAPIAIVPNGVDPAPSVLPAPHPWMDRPTLLFLGRLHQKKGIAELIDAFALAASNLPGWQLAIAGWDDGQNDFRVRAAKSGAPILFPGPLFGDEKAAAYAHAAAFVLPSHSEGLPMTVLEAWAHGRPVFMTQACNLPEGFAAGAAAQIETNPRLMADALVAGLRNHAFLAAAGQAGQRLVAKQFTWDSVAEQFRALYAYALGESNEPGVILHT